VTEEKNTNTAPTEKTEITRFKRGVFRDKVLEIYSRNSFKDPAAALMFGRGLSDGSYALNFEDFERLLRFWGTKKIWTITCGDGKGLLEIIVRYGSWKDFTIFKQFVENDHILNIGMMRSWAAESGNKVFLDALHDPEAK